MSKDCWSYLSYIYSININGTLHYSVPIVYDFFDVFLIGLSNLIFECDIKFFTIFELGAQPISMEHNCISYNMLKKKNS